MVSPFTRTPSEPKADGVPIYAPSMLADDRAVDDEVAGREGAAVRRGQEPVAGQPEDVAVVSLAQVLAGGHREVGPAREMHVPERAVAALAGIPAQHVQRGEAIEDGGVEALPLGVGAAGGAVDEGGGVGWGGGGAVPAGEGGAAGRGGPGNVFQ